MGGPARRGADPATEVGLGGILEQASLCARCQTWHSGSSALAEAQRRRYRSRPRKERRGHATLLRANREFKRQLVPGVECAHAPWFSLCAPEELQGREFGI